MTAATPGVLEAAPAAAATGSPAPPATMRAVLQDTFGRTPGDVLGLGEVPRPHIAPDEVLVRVAAASIDQGTWHLMAGLPYAVRVAGFGLRTPKALNPGRSFAGVVAATGADVSGFTPGDEVFGTCSGSLAEYASAQAGHVARKPANLTFEQAAAVPVSGLTALQAVRDHAHVRQGQTVLIIGASGGVGTFAVQIAKAFGAEVTGVCSTPKIELVRNLGADHVIDYSTEDFSDGSRRYDVIIDIGGNTPVGRLRRSLVRDGRLVIVGGESNGRWLGGAGRQMRAQMLSPFVSQTLTMFLTSENATDLGALRELIEAGKVVPAIDRIYALSQTAEAMRHLRDGRARGKVVISVAA